jgi:hypothetical protein
MMKVQNLAPIFALIALWIAAPQASSTSSAAAASTTCAQSTSGYYQFLAADSGTAADGTRLNGVSWEPGILAEFNPAPSNGYGPQLTVQSYQLDFSSGLLFDNIYPLCVNYNNDTYTWPDPNGVSTCDATTFDNDNAGGPFAPLVCNTDLYRSNLTCTVAAYEETLTTFYLELYQNGAQFLKIGTATEAAASGTQVTLIPVDPPC